jgi:hypothetical protein
MSGYEHTDFWGWLSDELAQEAHQARNSAGQLPPRPVCLSEVEAVGLLILAYDAQGHQLPGGLAAGAARRLCESLQGRLDHVADGGGGIRNASNQRLFPHS